MAGPCCKGRENSENVIKRSSSGVDAREGWVLYRGCMVVQQMTADVTGSVPRAAQRRCSVDPKLSRSQTDMKRHARTPKEASDKRLRWDSPSAQGSLFSGPSTDVLACVQYPRSQSAGNVWAAAADRKPGRLVARRLPRVMSRMDGGRWLIGMLKPSADLELRVVGGQSVVDSEPASAEVRGLGLVGDDTADRGLASQFMQRQEFQIVVWCFPVAKL